MTDIYQAIWDADMAGNGLRAIFDDQDGDAGAGFVKVNREAFEPGRTDGGTKVITEVVLPDAKRRTYELVTRLFDNFALDEGLIEVETPEERAEMHDLVQAMVDTGPMQVARAYVEEATGTTMSKERWYTTVMEMWFRPFSDGGRPALSGFEHVVVGEQKGSGISGYHFWFKYWLDDGIADKVDGTRPRFPGLKDDRIVYLRSKSDDDQAAFPESVTISYRWDAPDYERGKIRPLTKPTGGFFVGCSVEGLLAMGTVRAHVAARAPKEALINGARYDLKVFRSPDDQHVRTFYPMFLGPGGVAPRPLDASGRPVSDAPRRPAIVTGPVRIVAALVNPIGADPGSETVTLVNTAPTAVPLAGWRLVDKADHHHEIGDVTLQGGTGTTIILSPNAMQLSNKGGTIRLIDRSGQVVHFVSYSKAQASREGETVVF